MRTEGREGGLLLQTTVPTTISLNTFPFDTFSDAARYVAKLRS